MSVSKKPKNFEEEVIKHVISYMEYQDKEVKRLVDRVEKYDEFLEDMHYFVCTGCEDIYHRAKMNFCTLCESCLCTNCTLESGNDIYCLKCFSDRGLWTI